MTSCWGGIHVTLAHRMRMFRMWCAWAVSQAWCRTDLHKTTLSLLFLLRLIPFFLLLQLYYVQLEAVWFKLCLNLSFWHKNQSFFCKINILGLEFKSEFLVKRWYRFLRQILLQAGHYEMLVRSQKRPFNEHGRARKCSHVQELPLTRERRGGRGSTWPNQTLWF